MPHQHGVICRDCGEHFTHCTCHTLRPQDWRICPDCHQWLEECDCPDKEPRVIW